MFLGSSSRAQYHRQLCALQAELRCAHPRDGSLLCAGREEGGALTTVQKLVSATASAGEAERHAAVCCAERTCSRQVRLCVSTSLW